MSSEMRELINTIMRDCCESETSDPERDDTIMIREGTLREILERALLARTEAGADECTLGVGDGSGQLFVHGSYDAIKACQALILRNAAPVADGVVDITSRDYQAGFDAGVDFYDDGSGRNRDWRSTRPQDASGDAVLTGPGDHDDLPAFLEWVAGEVVRRDTRAGNFAEGLAQSLRGRAHILRIVKNDAMQAKEAK